MIVYHHHHGAWRAAYLTLGSKFCEATHKTGFFKLKKGRTTDVLAFCISYKKHHTSSASAKNCLVMNTISSEAFANMSNEDQTAYMANAERAILVLGRKIKRQRLAVKTTLKKPRKRN
jgi:hypothetical protein